MIDECSSVFFIIFQFKVLIGFCSPVRTFECLPLCFSLNVRFSTNFYDHVRIIFVFLFQYIYIDHATFIQSPEQLALIWNWPFQALLEIVNMYLKHRDPTAKQRVPEIRWRKLIKFLIFGLICWPVLFFLLCRTFFLSFCATKVYCTTSSFQNKIESLMIFWIVQRVWIRLLLWASNYMQICK